MGKSKRKSGGKRKAYKSQRQKRRKVHKPQRQKGWKKVFAVIGLVLLGGVVGFAVDEVRYYLERPRLYVEEAWAEVVWMTRGVESDYPSEIEVMAVAKDAFTGKQLLEKRKLTIGILTDEVTEFGISIELGQEEEVIYPEIKRYVGKILLTNRGRSDITNILIGISIPFESDLEVKITPNIEISKDVVSDGYDDKAGVDITTSVEYFQERLRAIPISKLPGNSQAVITIPWEFDTGNPSADVTYLLEGGEPVVPEVQFVFSDEGEGHVSRDTSFNKIIGIENEIMGGSFEIPWDQLLPHIVLPLVFKNLTDSTVTIRLQ